MLNTFPLLLVFGFFAPTVLRITMALLFIYMGMVTWQRREEISRTQLPLIHQSLGWVAPLAAIAEFALAAMFLFGWHTQIAALLGIATALKFAVYRKFWPDAARAFFPLSVGTGWMLFAISISLLLSGAGALALDLPL